MLTNVLMHFYGFESNDIYFVQFLKHVRHWRGNLATNGWVQKIMMKMTLLVNINSKVVGLRVHPKGCIAFEPLL